MTRLEIIEIRTTGKNHGALESYLVNWQAEAQTIVSAPLIKIYKHAALETDFSIHLLYDDETKESDVRILSDRLTADLKAFGLVNHTVWREYRGQ